MQTFSTDNKPAVRDFPDVPTLWRIINQTNPDQHHEKCSFRVAGMICDCAAFSVAYLAWGECLKLMDVVY